MVNVKADDGLEHKIDYNCKAAVMMILNPEDEDCDAVTSLMGTGNAKEIVDAIGKCTGEIITALTKDPVKRMALGLIVISEIHRASMGEGSTESKVVEDIRTPVKEGKE